MNTLVINIGWEYFLGVMGGLIVIAYYANGRFTALETNYAWLKEVLSELQIDFENQKAKLFERNSAVSLTAKGYDALARSGLRSYIDANRSQLRSQFGDLAELDSYELQRRAFRLLADLTFDAAVTRHLNTYAFVNGMSTTVLRRVGAIYLRDIVQRSE